jgi:phospholipid/cholesterol/gamma-HCH transport system substrate-binding protein
MAREPFEPSAPKRRVLGVVFVAMIVGLVTLSIAIYEKAFTTTVDVDLHADHTGNLLMPDSDVKLRGIIVGSVDSVSSDGDGSVAHLKLDPGRAHEIPSNVSAEILPKTLFGEQYVSLILPADAARPIKDGDAIPQDRSKGALESQRVLSDLLPLLTAVQPAQLNATLTALADALHGRGDELGRTLVTIDRYLKVINPHTRQFVADIEKLGRVALEYDALAPDILAGLQNLQTSARTVVAERAGLDSLLVSGSDSSAVLKQFLSDNERRIIAVTGQTNRIYPLLNRFSPEFTCLFQGINKLDGLTGQMIHDDQIHLSITVDEQNGGPYRPGQEPTALHGYGPQCFGLPDPPRPFDYPGRYRCINDGAPLTKDPCAQRAGSDSAGGRLVNSAAENAYVNSLVAGELHTAPDRVPATATLLAGPLLRGQHVVVK